ncbi:Uncharacterised protein [Yersinia enterocolitica]|nr:Uncharacterised protein [Yersinia enterocolitica]CQQ68179.1 Uncharacterised protein [Yersinia enterocolitica]CRX48546.1 Uncharacterised protein [Yersinia enterocolitica]
MTVALFVASLRLPSLHGDTELHISNSPKVIDLIDQCGNLAWLKFFVVTLAALQGRFCFIHHPAPPTLIQADTDLAVAFLHSLTDAFQPSVSPAPYQLDYHALLNRQNGG